MARRTIARVVDDSAVWTERIASAWQKTGDAWFETGCLLLAAKESLPHGKFGKMIRESLPFDRKWAHKLMSIAGDHRLTNVASRRHLPAEASTLYELTKLDDGTYALAEQRGLIRPDVTRKEIVALRQEVAGPAEPKPEPEFDVAAFLAEVHALVWDGMERATPSQRKLIVNDFKAMVHNLAGWKEEKYEDPT